MNSEDFGIGVCIKLQPGAQLPKKSNEYASGFDCYAYIPEGINNDVVIRQGENQVIQLGFSMEIPQGYEAALRPRSGLAKHGVVCALGTIDCDYRGVVGCNLYNHSWKPFTVKNGDRICQMVIQVVPKVTLFEVSVLSETERGDKGFGSSGV